MNKGYLLVDVLISIVIVGMISILAYTINDLKLGYNAEYHMYVMHETELIDTYKGVRCCVSQDLS